MPVVIQLIVCAEVDDNGTPTGSTLSVRKVSDCAEDSARFTKDASVAFQVLCDATHKLAAAVPEGGISAPDKPGESGNDA